MASSHANLVDELESITAEMVREKDGDLERLTGLTARRRQLLEELLCTGPLDEAATASLRAILILGEDVLASLAGRRGMLQRQLLEIGRSQRVLDALKSIAALPQLRLDVEG